MEHYFENIQGWFRAHSLYKLMVEAAPTDQPSVFVEVGCWKGRSSAFLGVEIVNSRKPITLICVDTFKGSPEFPHKRDPETSTLETVFRRNMQPLIDAGLSLQVMSMDSVEAANIVASERKRVDFVFIDAAHTYYAVRRDVSTWSKIAKCIGGDDYEIYDVACAVDDVFAFDDTQIIAGCTWFVDNPSHNPCILQPKRVCIATPTHDSKLWVGYVDSLLEECTRLDTAGIGYFIPRYDGDSFVSRCRDLLAAEFLSHEALTHLMWIDSDISWPPGIVRDFVNLNKPVLCGAYPVKTHPTRFVINTSTPDSPIDDARFMKVKDAGTGFMCIRRDVFDAIAPQCPQLVVHNTNYWDTVGESRKFIYASVARAYFSEMLEPVSDNAPFPNSVNRLTEDYAFCRRVQNAGIDIEMATLVPLAHFGAFIYDGDVAAHLQVDDGKTLREVVNAKAKDLQ